MGHCPRGTATAQLQTRHLRQAPPELPLHRPRKKKTLWGTRRPRDYGVGGWGGEQESRPALLGPSGSCALIGRCLQRASRLAPLRPLRFELHFCGFARAAPGSEAGFCLRQAGIGRSLYPRGCRVADWCVLCPPWFFLRFSPTSRVGGTAGEVLL